MLPEFLKPYRKLIPLVVGAIVIVVLRKFNIEIDGVDDILRDLFIYFLMGFGVYHAKNDPIPNRAIDSNKYNRK